MTLLAALMVLAGCQDDEAALPDPVSTTRSAILSAAKKRDYDALPPLIDPQLFVSDRTVAGWRRLGEKPLQTMEVLLQMPHQVRETNEGTLYEWPRFGPNSKPSDMTDDERRALRQVMTREPIVPEVGYTSPRLGILEDGRWWFFFLESGP